MLLDLDFKHTARVRFNDGRTPASVALAARITVSINEVSADEAPAVAVITRPTRNSYEIRKLGDGFLVPAAPDYGYQYDVERLRLSASDPISVMYMISRTTRGLHNTTLPDLSADDPSILKVTSSTKDEFEEEIRQWAFDKVMVDGVMWMTTPEPYLHYKPRHNSMDVDYGQFRFLPHRDEVGVFRLDRRDQAMKWILKYTGKWPKEDCDVDILLPGAFGIQADEWTLLREAGHLADWMRPEAEAADPSAEHLAFEKAFRTLSSETESGTAELDDHKVDGIRLAEVVEAVMGAREALHKSRRPHDRFRSDPSVAACEVAIKRLRDWSAPPDDDQLLSMGF
jgi:hypothetical protein